MLGLGCGSAMTTGPMYTSEIVPPRYRGKLVGVNDTFINAGIVFGYLVSYFIEKWLQYDFNWRIMVGCGVLPPILILCLIGLVPESPRWLVLTYPDRLDYARKSLYNVSKNEEEIQIILKEIQRSVSLTKRHNPPKNRNVRGNIFQALQSMYHWFFSADQYNEIPSDNSGNESEANIENITERTAQTIPEESYNYLFRETNIADYTKYFNFSLLLAMGIGLAQQVTGAESLVYYAPEILEKAGIDTYANAVGYSLFVGIAKILGDLFGIMLIDNIGRRPLMIWSSILVFLCTLAIGLALLYDLAWYLVLVFMCLYMFTFSMGLGVGTFLLCSELSPVHERARTMALCTSLNRILTGVSIVLFLNITSNKSMGYAYTYVFSVGGFISFLLHYFFTPETKNLTLEEVQLRYFSKFKNTGNPENLATRGENTSETQEGGEHGNEEPNENMALLP